MMMMRVHKCDVHEGYPAPAIGVPLVLSAVPADQRPSTKTVCVMSRYSLRSPRGGGCVGVVPYESVRWNAGDGLVDCHGISMALHIVDGDIAHGSIITMMTAFEAYGFQCRLWMEDVL